MTPDAQIVAARRAVDAAVNTRAADGTRPDDGGWALAPDALEFLERLVASIKPRRVLEFGSGVSTRTIAGAAAALDHPVSITSIDHDPVFGGEAAAALDGVPSSVTVEFVTVPLVARAVADEPLPAYLPERIDELPGGPADLVLIDGPPEALGGRGGVLYQALERSGPGTVIVVDDAARSSERRAIRRWHEVVGDAVEIRELDGFSRGLAVAIVHRPLRSFDLAGVA